MYTMNVYLMSKKHIVYSDKKSKSYFKDSFIDAILKEVVIEEKISYNFELSLSVIDDVQMRKLNLQYRNKNASTDVLSFREADSEVLFPGEENRVYWGDVIISHETAAKQAKERGHSLLRELAYLFVHGVLHLLNYDHERSAEEERIMFAKTDKILDSLIIETWDTYILEGY